MRFLQLIFDSHCRTEQRTIYERSASRRANWVEEMPLHMPGD